jgi:hypothetical protein
MKKKLGGKDFSSVPKPTTEIKIMWTANICQEYFKKLSDSMPTRIRKVIAAKGETTKY